MKSVLFAVLAASALATSAAQAGPGSEFAAFAEAIGETARARAREAAQRPAAPARPLDIEDPLSFELEQFSLEAMLMSRRIDEAGGPLDLRCIFRGMSADASARLDALNAAETAAEQAHIYTDLADLMADASEIAPAVDSDTDLSDVTLPASCPAVSGG
ncbi:hypothetical protein Mmar10_0598 [Maricaulis maris MCS10]|uniref:Uncharacterized protein n=1 Tax=Maricaulis maris (strain MCS10) TaxID=394221 RepID=Q0AS46_MARMM|nr:hypothetical protein [Maricaulis maris]ABI64891.1 hypothetical protein Mmar10_0598 [Maricaulis maris MCS10]